MIPAIVPPLTGLSVLVTRPAQQGDALAAGIAACGGEPIVFPSLAIEPIAAVAPSLHELVIFVSVHAVEHGARLIQKNAAMRIAAIGRATATALVAAGLPADIVPRMTATSEGLLEHPDLNATALRSVLIVRGEGGRETLRETFASRGATVSTLEVYRRVAPTLSAADIAALETRWAEQGIDVVTATSVETYLKLAQLLSERGRALLQTATLLAPSERIVAAARETGWRGEALVSGGADDASIIGALARWRTRARSHTR
jgi:uroporphyrinogen-III synthase